MVTTTTDAPVERLSIQARIEQLEGAIAEAHCHVDKIILQPPAPASELPGGLDSTLIRCTAQMSELNERLSRLAARVGLL